MKIFKSIANFFYNPQEVQNYLQRSEDTLCIEDKAVRALQLQALCNEIDHPASPWPLAASKAQNKLMFATIASSAAFVGGVATATALTVGGVAVVFGVLVPLSVALGIFEKKAYIPASARGAYQRARAELKQIKAQCRIDEVQNSPKLESFLAAFPDVAEGFKKVALIEGIRTHNTVPALPAPAAVPALEAPQQRLLITKKTTNG